MIRWPLLVRYVALACSLSSADQVPRTRNGKGPECAVDQAAVLRAADLREPLSGHDGAAGLGTPREHPHHDPAAERVAAEVVLTSAQSEVLDEGEPVDGEHVGRVGERVG